MGRCNKAFEFFTDFNSIKKSGLLLLFTLGFYFFSWNSVSAQSLVLDEPQLATDYRVDSILFDDNYAYLGGEFYTVGYFIRETGLITDMVNGTIDLSWPEISGGRVTTVVSDGVGGWYIGGQFTNVGGYTRNRLAHILGDKSVDQDWNPNADSSVYSIAVSGTDIYVGGYFTSVGGQTRNRIAKLNNTTGAADADWNPNADSAVNAIAISDTDIYAIGYFTTIGGQARSRIVKLNNTTGEADVNWNPNPNNSISAIAVSGSDVYVGGYFTTIGGQTRNRIAKLNNTTGEADLTWNPNANNSVSVIYISGTDVYTGGNFTTIGGQTRNRVAKLNNTTGSADATWNPNSNSRVQSFAIVGSDIFVGGPFTSIGGQTRKFVAKLNNTTGSADPTWNSITYGLGYSTVIAANSENVFIGGDIFLMENTTTRNYLARIDLSTGQVDTDWNPNPNNSVLVMKILGDDLYLGGQFTSIGGVTRNRLAKVNKDTGVVDATWNPNSNNLVQGITLSNSDVYVGGGFTNVGGQTRNYIAKLNNTTGAADLTWNPNANDWVNSIAVSGLDIYAGGWFTSIGGQARNRIAKLNNTTGEVNLSWNTSVDAPTAYMWVNDLKILGTDLYVGGYFDSIGGSSQKGAAKINTATGLIDPNWNLQLTGDFDNVYTIEFSESSVFVGGQFTSVKGESIRGLAKTDTITATPDSYFAELSTYLTFFAMQGKRYWIATEYNYPYLYTFTLESTPPTVSLNALINSQLSDNTPTLTGSASDIHGSVLNVEYQIDSTDGTWDSCIPDDGTFNQQTETFTCTPPSALSEGSHTMYVRAKDSNDNTTLLSSYAVKTFIIDTIAPSLAITYIDYYKVTPTRWLVNRRPFFQGISDPNANIQVTISSANISESITSNQEGSWSWKSITDLPLGTHNVLFTSTDAAGNSSSTSVTLVVMLSFNNKVEEDVIVEEEIITPPVPSPTEEENEEPPYVKPSTKITVLSFFDQNGEVMSNALVTIEGTDYYTDTKGEIRVPGLDSDKKYKVKIEYNGVEYESEVAGATDQQGSVVVNITDSNISKEIDWKRVSLYVGIPLLILVIIIFISKKSKNSNIG